MDKMTEKYPEETPEIDPLKLKQTPPSCYIVGLNQQSPKHVAQNVSL